MKSEVEKKQQELLVQRQEEIVKASDKLKELSDQLKQQQEELQESKRAHEKLQAVCEQQKQEATKNEALVEHLNKELNQYVLHGISSVPLSPVAPVPSVAPRSQRLYKPPNSALSALPSNIPPTDIMYNLP